MNPALRYTCLVLGIPLTVMVSYLLSCLMGEQYDPLQFWLYGAIGLPFGVGYAVRTARRERAARKRNTIR